MLVYVLRVMLTCALRHRLKNQKEEILSQKIKHLMHWLHKI